MNAELLAIFTGKLGYSESELTPEATLEDLEFDSLARVELSTQLENALGASITEDELDDSLTLGALDTLVAERATSKVG